MYFEAIYVFLPNGNALVNALILLFSSFEISDFVQIDGKPKLQKTNMAGKVQRKAVREIQPDAAQEDRENHAEKGSPPQTRA